MGNSTKRKLLDDSDSESDGGAAVDTGFKVNEEYAKRFEHNKKREEQHRLEEKLKKQAAEDDDESSSDEDEDEDGFLATEDLDAQISATLQALRSKDPKVYDSSVMFFKPDDGDASSMPKEKKEKPVYLKDYHREKLLAGDVGGSDDEEAAPQTFAQEQDALKKKLVSEMHASGSEGDSDSDDDDFVVKRKEPATANENGIHPSRAQAVGKVKIAEVDVKQAEKDPETFLSNFMAARAWVPEEGSKWKAFDSEEDDDEDEDEADNFEQAYNLRFEDPEKSKEVLKSYARDLAASRSVRREEKTGRSKRREAEKEKKEAEKRQRREEKARLRKLKLDEAESKLKKVKQAAGKVGKELNDEDWIKFLDDAWDDNKWEEEMNKRFGEDYYAVDEDLNKSGDEDEDTSDKKKKMKKPKWDDDIDIKDIVPDFDDEEDAGAALNQEDDDNNDDDEGQSSRPSKKRKTADIKKEKQEAAKQAKKERAKLEALVDSKLELTNHHLLSSSTSTFRYRETSPQSFGMTARDILLAPSDSALNDFAGLKKLATFRDEEKKRKDRKNLGKKARLRQWRRDTFGHEFEKTGPTYGFERFADEDGEDGNGQNQGGARILDTTEEAAGNVVEGSRKKKKRSKGKKGGSSKAGAEVDVEMTED